MASNDKEQPEKIFCIFHQKTDCPCIVPVIDNKTLIMRLEHHIRLNNRLNMHEGNEAEKPKRDEQTAAYQRRLDSLKTS